MARCKFIKTLKFQIKPDRKQRKLLLAEGAKEALISCLRGVCLVVDSNSIGTAVRLRTGEMSLSV